MSWPTEAEAVRRDTEALDPVVPDQPKMQGSPEEVARLRAESAAITERGYISALPVLGRDALIGVAGEFVSLVGPESEASEAGLLVRFLVTFGNLVGASPYFVVESDIHHTIVNMVAVGATARARKGVAAGRVRAVMHQVDEEWAKRDINGHASGQAIVADLDGAADARLFINEPEFSRFVKAAGWDGSILSDTARNLFDGVPVANRRAKDRVVVDQHHVTIVGSITADELARVLSDTDALNGFANRFLWIGVERAHRLPEGGRLDEDSLASIVTKTKEALIEARKVTRMRRTPEAGDLWRAFYLGLSDETPGLLGAVTARGDVMVLRLSMIYALLDASKMVAAEHVRAAIAVWRYSEESARQIFGDRTGDRDLDRLVDVLRTVGSQGIDRTAQYRMFGKRGTRAERARERAIGLGLAVERSEPTDGRPREVLYNADDAPAGESR